VARFSFLLFSNKRPREKKQETLYISKTLCERGFSRKVRNIQIFKRKKISKNEERDNHSAAIVKKYLKIQILMNLLDLCTLVRDGRVCALKFIEIRPIIGTTRFTFSIVFFYFSISQLLYVNR
jgi:hypothetical protein